MNNTTESENRNVKIANFDALGVKSLLVTLLYAGEDCGSAAFRLNETEQMNAYIVSFLTTGRTL